MRLSFFGHRSARVLDKCLRGLPGWATITTICVAATAMGYRGDWPTPVETFTLFATIVGIWGALHLPSRKSRVACAVLWVVLLVSLGLPTPPQRIGVDFRTFYEGSQILFDRHQSPYLAPGTTAFPFPTFFLIRLLSSAGRFSLEPTFLCFVGLQIVLLGIGLVLMRRVVRTETSGQDSDLARGLIQAGLLFHPVVLGGIGVGNSSVVAGVALIYAVWSWRCGSGEWWRHASAISLNLAWMVKPQLLMATGFFLICWWLERRQRPSALSRAAAIGRLVVPWAIALMAVSLPAAFPGSALAYRDFPWVAISWHTRIAEAYPNNYALSAILAKAVARILAVPASQTLPFLTAGIASLALLWNGLSLVAGKLDSLRAFLPWLLTTLIWTSLVWEWYLSLVLAGLLLMVGLACGTPVSQMSFGRLRLYAGIGFTMVLSSFAFMLGVLLLYFHSHELRAREVTDARGIANT